MGHHEVGRDQFLNELYFNHDCYQAQQVAHHRESLEYFSNLGIKNQVVITKGFGCPVNPCDFFNLPNNNLFCIPAFLSFFEGMKKKKKAGVIHVLYMTAPIWERFFPLNTSSYYISLSRTKCPQIGAFLSSTCSPKSYMKQINPNPNRP